MKFRRQEGFRYTFGNPIDCLFKINKIEDLAVNTEYGEGQIIDISPSGIKMFSLLNLATHPKKMEIEVRFVIENHTYQIPGVIQWQKKEVLKSGYSYGIKLDPTEEIAKSIIEGLKRHAENSLKSKNSQK
ncbi:MAG TPA: PilZ domain-containing protein [Bacillus bacterium]|nr:PilZ domain-containing protein [Bacillus sp. (in: firmicutes)]